MARVAARAMVVCVAATLSACMHAPPPATAAGLQQQALVQSGSSTASWPSAQWWRQYGSAELDALVSSALQDAPSLAAADARVQSAAAAVDAALAERRISLGADAQVQRQRLSDNALLPPRLLGFNWYSPSELGITARYGLDLAGRRRAEQRSAVARTAVATAERAAAELAIAHAVVSSYVSWQIDRAGLELAQQRLAALDAELQIAQSRVAAELARVDEVLQLRQLRAVALDQLGGYETSMQLQRVAIAALARRTPAELPAFTALALPTPHSDLPSSATLDLMSRRPDLIAARGRVEAAVATADVARAGFLPDMDLRALFGLSSRDVEHLLDSGSWAPQFTAALHLPLFDAGRVRSRHAGATADLRATVADYNERLLQAAAEINGALTEREASATLLPLREQQVATAAQLRALAQQRVAAGLSDVRPAHEATRHWLELQEALLPVRQAQWNAELKLIRALGGGYGAGDERQR